MERFQLNNKYGFKDDDNNIIVPAIYDAIPYSIGDRNIVRKDDKCGVVSQEGDIIIDFIFDGIEELTNGLYAVRVNLDQKNWECYVIDEFGKTIIKNSYKHIYNVGRYIQCFKEAYYEFHSFSSEANRYSYKWQKDGVVYDVNGNLIREGKAIEDLGTLLLFDVESKVIAFDVNESRLLLNVYDEFHQLTENRYIVRKSAEDGNWFFGVINKFEEIIIPFDYKYIKGHNKFIQCFKYAECEKEYHKSLNNHYTYDNFKDEIWYNTDGILIHEGKANYLFNSLLAVQSNNKWGVKNSSNQRIVNFFYDAISFISENIIICKDSNIGLLGENGNLIISPSYKKIESVNVQEGIYHDWHGKLYDCYSHEYFYDTNGCYFNWKGEKLDRLYHKETSVNDRGNILKSGESFFSIENTIILSTSNYSELFSVKTGIIPNSRYEEIHQLTNLSFCVKQNGLYGIYRVDTEELIIPCEYDRIVFKGGHTVLLCKNNKWGAKDLILPKHIFYNLLKVDIPLEYEELSILNENQTLFGAKKHYLTYFEKEDKYNYVILKRDGAECDKYDELKLEGQFTIYNSNRILTKKNEKFGFVSLSGFITIPFIYDEIKKREDGFWDVCIGESWGVIDIDGREIVSVKYNKPISFAIKENKTPNAISALNIVTTSIGNRKGIIDCSGKEIIPAIFEHLMICDEDGYFFGYDGYEDNHYSNFFTDVRCATWGYMNSKGEIIIDAKYDCFKVGAYFIQAGRDGCFVGSEDNNDYTHDDSYTGVYDLYTKEGDLIIGGFHEMIYDAEQEVFAFFFGGKWERYCSYSDDWNNIYCYDWRFAYLNDLWLILDKNLNTITRKEDGTQYHFDKGFIGKIEIRKEEKKVTHVYNMPIKLMHKGFSHFGDGCAIVKTSNDEHNSKKAILDIKSGAQSEFFDDVEQISTSQFFFAKGNRCGITTITSECVSAEYLVFTFPVEGYFFSIITLDETDCQVSLRHIANPSEVIAIAINRIKIDDLIDKIGFGRFKIQVDSPCELHDIKVPLLKVFDQSFQSLLNKEETSYFCNKWKDNYYFANDWRFGPSEDCGGYCDDDSDYMRDSWDAMTDGMYGDMPDGFDGDFDFLGR